MLLFDDITRVAMEPKTELETTFIFLNRSAQPAFGLVRDEIEKWLARYPLPQIARLFTVVTRNSRFSQSKPQHADLASLFKLEHSWPGKLFG